MSGREREGEGGRRRGMVGEMGVIWRKRLCLQSAALGLWTPVGRCCRVCHGLIVLTPTRLFTLMHVEVQAGGHARTHTRTRILSRHQHTHTFLRPGNSRTASVQVFPPFLAVIRIEISTVHPLSAASRSRVSVRQRTEFVSRMLLDCWSPSPSSLVGW